MELMEKSSDMEFAINFHKQLDKKQGKESPNKAWPELLIEYLKKGGDNERQK